MPSSKFTEKELFFKEQELIDLDNGDNTVDEGLLDSINILKSSRNTVEVPPVLIFPPRQHGFLGPISRQGLAEFTHLTSTSHALSRDSIQDRPKIIRTLSALNPISCTTSTIELVKNAATCKSSIPSQLKHSMSLLTPPTANSLREFSAVPRSNGKRKRPADIKVVPERRQYLKDMVIYFFPNDDKNAARRMRISKSIEYGALWFKEWREGITHVIVDNNITYDEVIRHLGVDSLPADVSVVNEHYVPDCLMYKSVVSPNQRRYQVSGLPEVTKIQDSPVFS